MSTILPLVGPSRQKDYDVNLSKSGATATGVAAGATATAAALGTVVGGPVGTVVGAAIGGLLAWRKKRARNSFVDNVFRDMVQPAVGSVVMCDLHAFEHSGIYVGGGRIVHRKGGDDGCIESVGPQEFLDRLDGWNNAISVYVSCKGTDAIGSPATADRARSALRIGHSQHDGYCPLNRNCHHFTRWCLTGDEDQGGLRLLLLLARGPAHGRIWHGQLEGLGLPPLATVLVGQQQFQMF